MYIYRQSAAGRSVYCKYGHSYTSYQIMTTQTVVMQNHSKDFQKMFLHPLCKHSVFMMI